jgi:hypothetical protein
VRRAALLAVTSACALVGTTATADAAPSAQGCTHAGSQRPGCVSGESTAPAAAPVGQPLASQEAAPAPATAPAAPAEHSPTEPTAVDDPPTIIQGTEPDPATPTDECRNLDGVQTSVPDTMYVDAYGNCVEPPDLAAGDGVDDGVEEGGIAAAGSGGAAHGGAGATGQVGSTVHGVAAGAGGGGGEAIAGTAHPTAVAGASAAPRVVATAGTSSLDSGDSGALPFTGLGLLGLALFGATLTMSGLLLRRRRRALSTRR